MFYHFRGELVYTDSTIAVVDCGGVGYKLSISLNTYNEISDCVGQEIKLFSHLQVREDAMELYGFYSHEELECFKLLISVSGVGPKAAMSILSIFTPDRFSFAVCTEDARALAKASGVPTKHIQYLEQNPEKIDGTKLNTLCDLSLALGCRIENIIEGAELIKKYKKLR